MNFIKKLLYKIVLKNLLKGSLILFAVVSVNSILLSILFTSQVSAQGNTTVTPTPQFEQAAAPCSLYELSWGSSDKDLGISIGLGGLFKQGQDGTLDSKNTAQKYLKQLYQTIGQKDPIFLPTAYSVSGNDDPIVGLTNDSTSDLAKITPGAIKMPCLLGSLTGLVPRRDGISDNPISNCLYKSIGTQLYSEYGAITCAKDNAIGNMRTGGCPINLRFYKSGVQTHSVTNKNSNPAEFNIRMITSPGSVLKRTTNFGDSATKDFHDAMVSFKSNSGTAKPFLNNITSTYITWQNDSSLTSTTYPLEGGGEIKVSDYLLNGLTTTGTDRRLNLADNWGPNVGVLTDHISGGLSWDQSLTDSSKVDENPFSNKELNTHMVGVYYINEANVADNLKNITFKCNSRPGNLQTTIDGNIVRKAITIYEWIPSSVIQFAFPTCEKVTGGTGAQIIELPSAIKVDGVTKKIVACTPCIVPDIFQTDLFGSPVLGIPTSIGCLPNSLSGLVTVLLRIATMTGGGIALLLVTINGLRIVLNGTNPDEIKKAQKGIINAVVGLLVLVSAVLILNVVGIKILDLGSVGGSQIQYITTGGK